MVDGYPIADPGHCDDGELAIHATALKHATRLGSAEAMLRVLQREVVLALRAYYRPDATESSRDRAMARLRAAAAVVRAARVGGGS